MAISLKKYQPQVGISKEGTGVQISSDLAAAAAGANYKAAASVVGDITSLGEKVLEKRERAEKERQLILKETKKIQKGNLKKQLTDKLNLAITEYKRASELETDPSIIGGEKDILLQQLNAQGIDLLSTIDREEFPNLYEELQVSFSILTEEAGVNAFYDGQSKIIAIGQAQADADFNKAVDAGDPELAAALLENNKELYYKTEAGVKSYETKVATLPGLTEIRQLTIDVKTNPEETLKKIEEQRSGGEVYYDVDSQALKTFETEAYQIIKRQQDNMATQFFLNEDYQNLDVLDQMQSVKAAIDEGRMPEKQGLAEIERLKNNIPLQGKFIIQLREAKEEIRQAMISGNDNKITEIINKYTSEPNLPNKFLSEIMNYATNKTLVTERFSHPDFKDVVGIQAGRLSESIADEELFDRNKLMEWWNGTFGSGSWNEMSSEDKDDAIYELSQYAMTDFEKAMESWVTSQDEMPSRAEIRNKATEEMLKVRKKYRIGNISNLVEEYNLFNTGDIVDFNDLSDKR